MAKLRLAPLDIQHAENLGVLAYLAQGERADRPAIARPSSVVDPYYNCGSHPDVVERVWDDLGRNLPRACRALVFGNPSLVHAEKGIVLAVALGTSYALRVSAAALAGPAGAALESAHTYRTSGTTLDLTSWGPQWRFGGWHAQEIEWLAASYAEVGDNPVQAPHRPS